jgi:hypothetical protein
MFPLFDRLLALIYREAMNSKGVNGERYQMFMVWYDRIDDTKLEAAGVLAYDYVNPDCD